METKFIKSGVIVFLSIVLSACVVAPPPQPIGYRMTSTVMPTYVNGQYVGTQPGTAPDQGVTQTPLSSTDQQPAAVQQSTTYVQQPSSVVYVQSQTPVYSNYYPGYYDPYYAPVYVNPWYGVGVGLGVGIGVNYFRGGCCWRGGYRGGYRGGRGWRR